MKSQTLVVVGLLLALFAVVWFMVGGGRPVGIGEVGSPALGGESVEAEGSTVAGMGSDLARDAVPESERSRRAAAAPPFAPVRNVGRGIRGRAVDAAGEPLADVEVRVTRTPSMAPEDGEMAAIDWSDEEAFRDLQRELIAQRTTGRTAADGSFRVAAPVNARAVDVELARRGFAANERRQLRLTGDGDLDTGTWTLERGMVLAGRVVDGRGRGIADATVLHTEAELDSTWMLMTLAADSIDLTLRATRSDADGRFELPHLPTMTGRLLVACADHPTTQTEPIPGEPGAVRDDLTIVVADGAMISGRVEGAALAQRQLRVSASDAAQDSPDLSGFQLMACERRADVDDVGRFELRGLRAGARYRLELGEATQLAFLPRSASSPVEALAGQRDVVLRYEPGVTVRARLVDAATGMPLPAVFVTPLPVHGAGEMFDLLGAGTEHTSEDGVVEIPGLEPDEATAFRFAFRATGYAELRTEPTTLPLQGTHDLGTIRLQPVPTLAVQVFGPDGERPLPGASVEVRSTDTKDPKTAGFLFAMDPDARLRTDEDGRLVRNLDPGQRFQVFVQHPDFAPHLGEPETAPSSGIVARRILLTAGGSVEVLALEADGQTPAKDFEVGWVAPTGPQLGRTVDASGRVIFDRLAPGRHLFRILDGGDAAPIDMLIESGSSSGEVTAAPGWEPVDVVEGQRSELRLTLPPAAEIIGTVREAGLPLAGAEILLTSSFVQPPPGVSGPDWDEFTNSQSYRSLTTDASGSFRIDRIAAGTYDIELRHPSRRMPARRTVEIALGDNRVDIDLDLTIARGVVRGPDGRPIAGAHVGIREEESAMVHFGRVEHESPFTDRYEALPIQAPDLEATSAADNSTTGPDGAFELRGIAPGIAFRIVAEHPLHAAAKSDPLTATPGGQLDGITLTLGPGGALRVHLPDGVVDGVVNASRVGGEEQTDEYFWGSPDMVLLQGLRPGAWEVTVEPDDREGSTRRIEVQAGKTVDLRF